MITLEDIKRLFHKKQEDEIMGDLPEGRSPLPNEWFVDRAKALQNIREFDDEERQRAKQKEEKNRERKD
ncbi:hypothetical protein CRP804_gp48 [Roseobacter phage CRP-804]|uniref:Uncharacterized protein n=1 Tax=Roseobacter phage CRP-804 TaxID=3072850 RepID=A0AAX3ZWQ1_9CAUD|nr:hypothetical protein CRP804_gp48 [Roseobacter phage CRP-804]